MRGSSRTWCFVLFFLLGIALAGEALATIYTVGPGKSYPNLASVPFDQLEPGDTVKIHYRKAPYRERIILRRSGTKERPIRIQGIPNKGRLPVIDGRLARQFQKEKWKNSGRWLIKVGDETPGDYIRIENLVLKNANNLVPTIEPDGKRLYTANAAGVFLRYGRHVVLVN